MLEVDNVFVPSEACLKLNSYEEDCIRLGANPTDIPLPASVRADKNRY